MDGPAGLDIPDGVRKKRRGGVGGRSEGAYVAQGCESDAVVSEAACVSLLTNGGKKQAHGETSLHLVRVSHTNRHFAST